MKQYKVVGQIHHREWDDDWQCWEEWDQDQTAITVWGRLCRVGREILYRLHLRKRPTFPTLLAKYYKPAIEQAIYQESPLLAMLRKRHGK